ncbi:MAG: type II secretion system protein GspM [Pseudomonadota bacterium]
MKNWWFGLALREKQTISMGILLVLIFLIYEIIFAPLSDKVNELRHKVRSDQTLLNWMQASNERINSLEKNQQYSSHSGETTSLLSVVQNGINESAIAQNVSQLQQAENDSVQLQLQKVNFDSFIQWLTLLCQQHQLLITQMSITPLDTTGTVNTELKLSRA